MKKIFTLIAVAMLALAAQAETLTVCEGEYYSAGIPVYGLWYDTPGMTQQIYSADLLAEMAGGQITELSFYTLAAYSEEYADYVINFYGGEVTLSFMEVEQPYFTEATPMEGAKVVATLVPEAGGSELKFVLDEPYTYQGGNLLVQVEVTEAGSYGSTYFWGTASEEEDAPTPTYLENYNYAGEISSASTSSFLARATFTYTLGDETKYYITGGFNGWLTQDPPELTEEGYTFTAVDDPEGDHPLDFKLLTWGGEDWIWIGGISENEGVDYFDVTDEMMENGQELSLYAGPEYVNFRLPAAGTYKVALVREDGAKDPLADVKIVVSKENEPTPTAVNDINAKAVAGVKYVNIAGMESDKPFDGVNIVVTTYTDGTKSAVKVIK